MDFLKLFIVVSSFHFCLVKSAKSTADEDCNRVKEVIGIGFHEGKITKVDVGACAIRQSGAASSNCIPLSITEERRVLCDGNCLIQKEIIHTCQLVSSTCQRLPRMVTFYPETSYNTTIDVGVCGGLCKHQSSCKPVWKKTGTIPSPNGVDSIEKIMNCSCVKPYCYRVTHFEGFLEQYEDAKGNNATRTKIVDMGECVSESMCPLSHTSGSPFNKHPKFLLPSKCNSKVRSHTFVSSGGRRMNVATITMCSCH